MFTFMGWHESHPNPETSVLHSPQLSLVHAVVQEPIPSNWPIPSPVCISTSTATTFPVLTEQSTAPQTQPEDPREPSPVVPAPHLAVAMQGELTEVSLTDSRIPKPNATLSPEPQRDLSAPPPDTDTPSFNLPSASKESPRPEATPLPNKHPQRDTPSLTALNQQSDDEDGPRPTLDVDLDAIFDPESSVRGSAAARPGSSVQQSGADTAPGATPIVHRAGSEKVSHFCWQPGSVFSASHFTC